ncbi:MAG: type II secretion system ATPase GspE [Elusimicrobia bacterium]|nr:type II secretion system ATPase GspE [Candidatus Liberimonas magnetica]
MKTEQIGQILLKDKKITEKELSSVLSEQKKSGERLGKLLIKHGHAKEKDILEALSRQFNIPVEDISRLKIDVTLAEKVPAKFAYRHKIAPVNQENGVLTVAVTDPLNLHALDDLRLILECGIRPVLCPEADILKSLKTIYGVGGQTIEELADKETKTISGGPLHLEEVKTLAETNTGDASIINFVNQLICEAHQDRATDIHLEPFEDDLIVRYRIDGILHEIPTPASLKTFQSSITSRIKIMADMNIAEKRLPQDGRIQFNINGETVDIRVSTLPILHGESIDLRILPRGQMFIGLGELGLSKEYLTAIEKLIKKPHGIILATGPTGHGKTTTLYACLSKINFPDKKIITVEDPIEYQLKGVNQVPVNSKIGLSFANGLRSILRQDPDVIMVGEIRDQETAEIAIRASLTGHLVFSTLHTNDSAGAVTRLVDMGIEPYLVSSSVEAVLAQRLIRLVCPKCKVQDTSDKDFLTKLGFRDIERNTIIYKASKGCDECRHTGYKGRTGIYELMLLDDDLRRLVLEKTSAGNIRKEALKKNMKTLRDDGFRKILAGLTTIEEVLRVTQEENF